MFKKLPKNLSDKELSAALGEHDYSPLALPTPFTPGLKTATPAAAPTQVAETDLIQENEEPETTISENVSMRGSLTFQNVLRIDGSFEGELLSQGKLIVGPKGHVKAHIDLDEAFISGKVEGNIHVRRRLVLRGRAEIKGDITAASLSVDEGVHITGHVRVSQPDANLLASDFDNPLHI